MSKKFVIDITELENGDLKDLGQEGYERNLVRELGLRNPPMFFITENAFKEFISSSNIVSKFSKLLANEKTSEEKLKDKYNNLIKYLQTVELSDELKNEIGYIYHKLSTIDKPPFVEIRLANKDKDKRYIENIKPILLQGPEDIESTIKEIWLSEMTFERVKSMDPDGSNNIDFVIQILKILPYESTGFVYNYLSALNIEINSVFGLWLDGEELEQFDVHFVDTKSERVVDKKISTQKKMIVKQGKEIMEIPVAGRWSKTEKLSTVHIQKLVAFSKKAISDIGKSIEFSFGFYKGKLYIQDLKKIIEKKVEENEYYFAPDFVNSSKDQNFSHFHDEIDIIASLDLPPIITNSHAEVVKKKTIGIDQKGLLLSRLKKKLNYRPFVNELGAVTDIYVNLLQAERDPYKFMTEYKGVYTDMDKYLKLNSTINKKGIITAYKEFKTATKEIANFIYHLEPTNLILKLSEPKLYKTIGDSIVTDRYSLSKIKNLEYLHKVGFEVLLIKKLLEDYDFHNLSITLPSLNTLEDLQFFYNVFNSIGLTAKADQIKIYLDLSKPSFLYEIKRDSFGVHNLLDGVIVNFEVFMANFLSKNLFTQRDYELTFEALYPVLLKVRDAKLDLFIILNENMEIGKRFLDFNPKGFVVRD